MPALFSLADLTTLSPRGPIEHELKTREPFWCDVNVGRKPFEIRVNDRDFRVGDTLHLVSTETGARCIRRVTYLVDGPPFLPAGLCVMGIRPDTVELREVLDTLDRWLIQRAGLQRLGFSYVAEGGFRVSIQVERVGGRVRVGEEGSSKQ